MWLRRADTSLAQTIEKHSQPGKLVPRYIDQQRTGLFDEQIFSMSLQLELQLSSDPKLISDDHLGHGQGPANILMPDSYHIARTQNNSFRAVGLVRREERYAGEKMKEIFCSQTNLAQKSHLLQRTTYQFQNYFPSSWMFLGEWKDGLRSGFGILVIKDTSVTTSGGSDHNTKADCSSPVVKTSSSTYQGQLSPLATSISNLVSKRIIISGLFSIHDLFTSRVFETQKS